METFIICIITVVALFAAAFIAKRRFGLLGFALAAGSILSGIWGYDAGLIAGFFSIPSGLTTTAVGSALIVLLPAVVLLFHGDTYKTLVGRITGASLFTLLATAFLIEPQSHVLMPHGFGANVYKWLVDNRTMVIGAGLIAAVVDLFLTKSANFIGKQHKKH